MSGATNCPETPRQKMIGMMYLMLTAELALNVGREVLDAFSLVDDSLTTTTEIFTKKNKRLKFYIALGKINRNDFKLCLTRYILTIFKNTYNICYS